MNPVNKKHIVSTIHYMLENVWLEIRAICAKLNMISSHLGHKPLLTSTHFFKS